MPRPMMPICAGLALYRRGAPADNAAAAEAFRRAIDLERRLRRRAQPRSPRRSWRAGIERAGLCRLPWTSIGRPALAEAWALVDEVGPRPDADQEIVRSRLALRKHQHERALAAAEVASALRPNDVEAMQVLAEATIYAGDPAEGRRLAEQVLRRDPVTPAQAHFLIGLADFEAGRTGDAIAPRARTRRCRSSGRRRCLCRDPGRYPGAGRAAGRGGRGLPSICGQLSGPPLDVLDHGSGAVRKSSLPHLAQYRLGLGGVHLSVP